MIIILFCWLLYTGAILFYQPQKKSFRDTVQVPFGQRVYKAKGTLLLGTLLFAISLFTFGSKTFLTINPTMASILGYVPKLFFYRHFYWQPLSSLFVHFDLIHLASNLTMLLLLSAYERRVGLKRYLAVYCIAGLGASLVELILSALVLGTHAQYVSMGASGAICGLIAAHYLDTEEKASTGDWIKSSLILMLLITIMSFLPQSNYKTNTQVDWIAHLLGALIACLYIRFRPLHQKAELANN